MLAIEGFTEDTSYGNKFYIANRKEDARNTISNLSLLKMNKKNIMKNLIAKQNLRKEIMKNDARLRGTNIKEFDEFLDGTIFDGIKEQGSNSAFIGSEQFLQLERCGSILREKSLEIEKIDEFVAELKNFINTLVEDENIYKSIITEVIEKHADIKGMPVDSKTEEIVLKSILTHENDEIIANAVKNSGLNLPSTIGRLIITAQALSNPPSGFDINANFIAKSSSGKNQEGTLATIIKNKVSAWTLYLERIVAETAFAQATIQGSNKLAEKFLELNVGIEHSGSGSVQIKMKEDPVMRKWLNESGADKAQIGKNFSKVSKADSHLSFDNGSARGSIGITVKNMSAQNLTDIASKNGKLNIHLQSGTPLITLMAREAGLSINDIHGFIQTAVVGTSEWDMIKNNIATLSLLDTLAGSSFAKEDWNNYMVINGRIWTISFLLNHIYETIADGGTNVLMTLASGTNAKGLNQESYKALNKRVNAYQRNGKKISAKKNNPAPASIRSYRTFTQSIKLMYDTKININLNLAMLSKLL